MCRNTQLDINIPFTVVLFYNSCRNLNVLAGLNTVLIKATTVDNQFNFTKLELVYLNSTVGQVIPLCPVPGHPGLYSGGPFVPPNDFFYLSVSTKMVEVELLIELITVLNIIYSLIASTNSLFSFTADKKYK